MGVLDDAFADLTAQVQTQLGEAATVVLRRDMVGTFSASAGTETGGTEIVSGALVCVRTSDQVVNIAGASGGYSRKRVVVYLLSKATLAADTGWTAGGGGAGGAPRENDAVVETGGSGASVYRRVTDVVEQVHRTMWKITTMSEP